MTTHTPLPPSTTMLLETVASTAALRALPADALPGLAEEIRAFLVSKVAATGGHLGPNLGAVELTIALHRVFDSPVMRSSSTRGTRPTSTSW